ncbi:hypothetical protein MHU86_21947 [Fragilaria crotonensis]|nr:hypothetical protein MHU86_21947 [Fragilaria crotonensis]
MTSLSPPSSRELIAQPSVSHLVERHHSESSSRQTDLGQISATAGCTSRSAPDLGSPLRKRMPRVPTGNREHDKSNCKEEGKEKSKRRDKSKDKSKCKDKTKTREKDTKETPKTSKVTASLTTRSWRAKLAEHFGRSLETNPPIGKARNYRHAPIPTTLLCSDDFASDILDDLTEIA